jgi:hypothetical protein
MARDKTDKTDKTPAATPKLNEWGIPNWHEPVNYGDVKLWNLNRWRWEFYRRRNDLREYFDRHAEETADWKERLFDGHPTQMKFLSPTQPGFVVYPAVKERRKFGYQFLPNPRIGEQDDWRLIPLGQETSLDYIVQDKRYTSYAGWLEAATKSVNSRMTDANFRSILRALSTTNIDLEKNELGLIFRLDLPLGPQLETAKTQLAKAQLRTFDKPKQRRRSPTKWLEYLRTLDAREEGATWATIARIYPLKKGTEQTARDTWNQANALCFNF